MRALAFVVAFAVSSAAVAAANCKLVRIAEWPVRLHNNRVVVDGSINGQDLGVLLDTGAYRSALSRSAAQRLGLQGIGQAEREREGLRFRHLSPDSLARRAFFRRQFRQGGCIAEIGQVVVRLPVTQGLDNA